MAQPALDLKNVQGDSIIGFPKKAEAFYFFEIKSARVNDFRKQLGRLVPQVTNAAQARNNKRAIDDSKSAGKKELLKISGLNIAFSKKGLRILGINDNTGDTAFEKGMLADAKDLGDNGKSTPDNKFDPAWDPAFKQGIHALILAAGDSVRTVNEVISKVENNFHVGKPDATIRLIKRIDGKVRPNGEEGHEHFGFLDGVSEPRIVGIPSKPHPDGEKPVRQGIFLAGRDGDQISNRPAWTLDGSFLAFRLLPQLVPEFNKFLKDNPIPGVLPPSKGSELLGARLVGRWKSGAPIDISPLADDKALAADDKRNNNFRFNFNGDQTVQDRCPFAAHIRKTNPRADLDRFGGTETRRILRRGIQFGEELTKEEIDSGRTKLQRGLLFVSYQSDIPHGFRFIQISWSNAVDFPPGKPIAESGFDPISGQAGGGGSRSIIGTNPKAQAQPLKLTAEWVISRGGEYFFSPSIPALKNKFALKDSTAQPPDLGKLSLGNQPKTDLASGPSRDSQAHTTPGSQQQRKR